MATVRNIALGTADTLPDPNPRGVSTRGREMAPLLSRVVNVLLVEDSAVTRNELRGRLERSALNVRVTAVADGFAGYQALLRGGIDVVLCDVRMPRCDGMQFLRMRTANAALRRIPVIMLTAHDETEDRVESLRAGACDYVSKTADPRELAARIAVHVQLKQTYDDLAREASELERLCRTDALTGLLNRRALREALETELSRARRYGRPLSFAMIDLDRFKQVNDTLGHQGGDHVLAHVAKLVSTASRAHDVVARYGGEEIAILFPETGLRGAMLVAERIRSTIERSTCVWEGRDVKVTVSIGVSSSDSTAQCSADALFRSADHALYRAKSAGRNRIAVEDYTALGEEAKTR